MIKNKIADFLKRLNSPIEDYYPLGKSPIEDYALIIEIESFTDNVDLVKILDKPISYIKKKSKIDKINLECQEPIIGYEIDKKLSKLISVIEYKHTTFLSITFLVNYQFVKRFEEEEAAVIDKIKQILEKNKIYAEFDYDIRIAKEYNQRSFLSFTMNLNEKQKSLKTRIKNLLWLKYGVDDTLPEKQIDKIVSTFEKAKVEIFWIKKDNSVVKLEG